MKKNLIFSTCGTSLLTNGVSNDLRKVINDHANTKENDLDSATKELLINHINDVEKKLFNSSLEKVTELSAELHSIIRYYDYQLNDRENDFHFLLTTDTFLGSQTGLIIKKWLSQYIPTVQVLEQTNLQTKNLTLFQWAIADLVKWIDTNITRYKENNYHVVFNLTGGFKSVQGFLQTLSMFYADESLYVFESNNELFRLPKIPVKLIPQEIVENHFSFFRQLDLNLNPTIPEGIPEVMLLKLENEVVLSDYGQIIYQQTKRKLYGERIWEPPINKIRFGSNFYKSVEGLDEKRTRIINEKIDDLTRYLKEKKDLRSLDFKKLKGKPKANSTHEIDAWSDLDAKRIFGHFEDDIFVLDSLDKGLH